MECRIDWGGPDGMLFVARTGTGHIAAMDGAPDGGGNNLAPRPMEMILVGTGGCTAYDVVQIDWSVRIVEGGAAQAVPA